MSDVFRSLCVDLVHIADAMDGGKSSIANQGQALDGFSALANFRGLADVARKELAKPEPEPPTIDCDEVEVPAYHRGDAFFVYKEGYAAGWGAGIKTAVESEQLNPWKAELIDALVCSHILQKEHYSSPRKALNDLIAWDIQVATDPRVSSTALQKPKLFNEEPPTADDADEDGLVWGLDAHLSWKRTHWRLIGKFGYQHWLPLWALPLPTVNENS
jgi:hypothetical protein